MRIIINVAKGGIFIKIFKRLGIILTFLLIFSLSFVKLAANENEYVLLGGESIGLNMTTEVIVTGKYQVSTKSGKETPWKNSNILVDDVIIEANNKEINSIKDLQAAISDVDDNSEILIKVKRDNSIVSTKIKVIQNSNDSSSIGLYVKDKVIGVGTITYYTLKGSYGALGHGVCSNEFEGELGKIMPSKITSVKKAVEGIPGEKMAELEKNTIGTIEKNTNIGVFGKITDTSLIKDNNVIEVASINEIAIGKAQIVTVLEGNQKEYFDIEIINVQMQTEKGIKGIKFKVVDDELISKTGGIIQGMSGSPIIQNKKLIGAVSHVIIDNPKTGYGVFAEWMLLE